MCSALIITMQWSILLPNVWDLNYCFSQKTFFPQSLQRIFSVLVFLCHDSFHLSAFHPIFQCCIILSTGSMIILTKYVKKLIFRTFISEVHNFNFGWHCQAFCFGFSLISHDKSGGIIITCYTSSCPLYTSSEVANHPTERAALTGHLRATV
jgi:hypothetical protein